MWEYLSVKSSLDLMDTTELNDYGKEDWELVNTIHNPYASVPDDSFTYVFKRPKK